MLKKYHKDIGFLPCHIAEAKGLIKALQWRRIAFSSHAISELMQEAESVKIGQFLRDYQLNFVDVFEIVVFNGIIQKIGFRINFSEKDVIFILSREKQIITLWTNKKSDLHYTLNTLNYCKV